MRAQWAEFITRRSARYLSVVGDVAREESLHLPSDAVDHFLKRLRGTGGDLQLIAQVHYLTQLRVAQFVHEQLGSLVRAISHATVPEIEVSLRGARGKVLWPETRRRIDTAMIEPGAFIVRRAERSADVPENQLLKLLLHQLSAAVQGIGLRVGTGHLLSALDALRTECDQALREPYMRTVTRPSSASARMRQRAERNRNWRYGEAAQIQVGFENAVRQNKWQTILDLVQRGWMAPVDDDDLFELYVLVLVLDILEAEIGLGPPTFYGLIRARRKEVAEFQSDTGELTRVFFDQSMAEVFSYQSRYRALVRSYEGLTGQEHRPDLSVSVASPSRPERRLLIEMKRSSDPRYRSESVYKCFGYLHDLEGLWSNEPAQAPKLVLVFPEGVRRRDSVQSDGNDLAACAADDRGRLAELIRSALF